MYIRNRIRMAQARLCVSCFIRFGFIFPLKPSKEQRNIQNLIYICAYFCIYRLGRRISETSEKEAFNPALIRGYPTLQRNRYLFKELFPLPILRNQLEPTRINFCLQTIFLFMRPLGIK